MLKYRLWGGPSTTHSVCSIVCFSIQAWLYCGKVWDHCHAKIYHSSVFPTCFPFIEASSTETISDEVSVDETKDQMDLSDPASGLCWIVFSCYLQTWHSDTFHHLQIFFSPATSYFVLYLPSLDFSQTQFTPCWEVCSFLWILLLVQKYGFLSAKLCFKFTYLYRFN